MHRKLISLGKWKYYVFSYHEHELKNVNNNKYGFTFQTSREPEIEKKSSYGGHE